MPRTLEGNVLLDTKQANQSLDQLEKKGNSTAGKMEKDYAQLGATMTSSFMKAKVAVDALYSVAGKAIQFGKEAFNLAKDAGETQSLIKTVFKENTKAIEEWATATTASLTQTKLKTEQQAASFFLMAKNLGFTKDSSLELSKQMTNLAADLASFYNTSNEEAMGAIMSGFQGQTEVLRKYGIFLNDATLKQEAYNLGLYKGKGTLDQYAKAAATASIIFKSTNEAQGDLNRTQDSTSNQLKQLSARWEEFQTKVGETLAQSPALNNALKYAKEHMDSLEKVATAAAVAVGILIGANALGGLVNSVGAIRIACISIAGSIKAIGLAAISSNGGVLTLIGNLGVLAAAAGLVIEGFNQNKEGRKQVKQQMDDFDIWSRMEVYRKKRGLPPGPAVDSPEFQANKQELIDFINATESTNGGYGNNLNYPGGNNGNPPGNDKKAKERDSYWPLSSKYQHISSDYYDKRSSGLHGKIDISAPSGADVIATRAGTVLGIWEAGAESGGGKMVFIEDSSGHVAMYTHVKGVLPKVNETVKAGAKIAEVYNNHLDFGVFDEKYWNPKGYAKGKSPWRLGLTDDPVAYINDKKKFEQKLYDLGIIGSEGSDALEWLKTGELKGNIGDYKDDLEYLNKEAERLRSDLERAELSNAPQLTIDSLKNQLETVEKIGSALQNVIQPMEEERNRLYEEQKKSLEDIVDLYDKQIQKEDDLQSSLINKIEDIKDLRNALSPGSEAEDAESFIKRYKDAGGNFGDAQVEELMQWEKDWESKGFDVTFEDIINKAKEMGASAEALKTPLDQNTQALKDSNQRELELISALNDYVTRLERLNWYQSGNVGPYNTSTPNPNGSLPTTPLHKNVGPYMNVGPYLNNGSSNGFNPSDWVYEDSNCSSGTCSQTAVNRITGERISADEYISRKNGKGSKKVVVPQSYQNKLDQDAKDQEDARKKAEEEAQKAQEARRRALEEQFNIGKEIGAALGEGLLNNDWESMGRTIGSFISQAIESSTVNMGLFGGVLSGFIGFGIDKLIGSIFGKKKRNPTKAEAIPVQVVNWSDLQSSLLNVTKQSLIGATSGRINRLNNLRIDQALVGI